MTLRRTLRPARAFTSLIVEPIEKRVADLRLTPVVVMVLVILEMDQIIG